MSQEDPNEFPILQRRVADETKALNKRLGADYGVAVFVFAYHSEEFAYAATGKRGDVVTLLLEFLDHQDPEVVKQAIERLQAQKQFGPEGSA